MSELSPAEAIDVCSPIFQKVGGAFMLHPDVLGPCRDHGYPNGFVYYGRGRGGVLGEVDADVVAAAFGYFRPDLVRRIWEAGVSVEGARAASTRYAADAAAWGRARLAGVEGLARFVEIAERLVDAVDPAGLALFAGWRAEPRPGDDAGRAYLLTHVLREWRGSVHVVATVAAGLTAVEAVLANPGGPGPDGAKLFGWTEPYPEITDDLVARRVAAEAHTSRLMLPAYEQLTGADRAGLASIAGAIRTSVGPD